MKRKLSGMLTLFLALVVQLTFAQEKTITGVVSDDSGLPLPGTTVLVKGTSTGVSTDFDGKYSINASTGQVLVFSFVGYKNEEKTIGSSNIINVLMQEDVSSLEEVVVVAYGTQKKEALTGSVGEVKTEIIEQITSSNVVQGIVGKVAGVQVVNNSGQPGAAPTVRIRGIGSINASNEPLYVVNGVPFSGSITSINPSDIESFTVLKDAAAAALYGSRGSNGVIIITTKKGTRNATTFNIDVSTIHTSRGSKDYDVITDPGMYYEAHFLSLKNFLIASGETPTDAANIAADNMVQDNAGTGFSLGYNNYDVPDNQIIDPLTGKLNPSANLLYYDDWNEYMFNNSFSTRTFLSINGGDETSKFYFSLGHQNDKAYAIRSNFERVTANISLEKTIKENLTIGGTMNYAHTVQNIPDQGGYAGAFTWSRSIAPIYPIFGYNLDGSPVLDSNGNQVYDYGDGQTGTPQIRRYASFANPYATTLLDIKKRTTDNFNGLAFLKYNFLEDFTFTYNISGDLRSRHGVSFDTPLGGDAYGVEGRSTPNAWRNFSFGQQQLLTWNKSFGNHNFNVLVGHETGDQSYVYLDAQKTKFLLPDQTVLDYGVNFQYITNYEFDYRIEGYLSRVNYDFSNKYFLNASYRRDASSVFHPDNRWGDFYGAGVAWRISEESFLSDSSWLSELKLKTSIGQQGNDRILYSDATTTADRNYIAYEDQYIVSNNNGNIGLSLQYQGNEDLTWETSTNFNAGFELGLFEDRVTVDAEYFERKVADLLFNTPQAPSSGLPSFPENVGDMENKGFEVTVFAEPVRSKNFDWSINFNATHFKNEITKLPEGRESIENGAFQLEVGRSRYDYYSREFAGVNPNNGAALFYKDILDTNGDPTGEREVTEEWTDADEYFIEKNALPDLYGGFGTSFRFKNITLGLNFAYQFGGYGRDNTYIELLSGEAGENLHKDVFKTWTIDNPDAKLPLVVPNNDLNYYATSNIRLIESDFLSLQDVNIAYNLNPDVAEKIGMSSARIYLNANNVYLWSKRQGYDPRLSLTGLNTDDDFSLVRQITLGINLKF
ncbi:SusC/RagA family TonB-linked outer membrane protein [Aestuariivivens sediminicola]|uniref:SusC/RagA family TonB-linked outer membrane protein n=1 Tax=Aestuariivivens sediminicola TaxID=2913560 RepID=UPI001F5AB0A4|nr:SusC/RagA family TonB-linked outer membrane protein [Aestuariivivens sediminicola]